MIFNNIVYDEAIYKNQLLRKLEWKLITTITTAHVRKLSDPI